MQKVALSLTSGVAQEQELEEENKRIFLERCYLTRTICHKFYNKETTFPIQKGPLRRLGTSRFRIRTGRIAFLGCFYLLIVYLQSHLPKFVLFCSFVIRYPKISDSRLRFGFRFSFRCLQGPCHYPPTMHRPRPEGKSLHIVNVKVGHVSQERVCSQTKRTQES